MHVDRMAAASLVWLDGQHSLTQLRARTKRRRKIRLQLLGRSIGRLVGESRK